MINYFDIVLLNPASPSKTILVNVSKRPSPFIAPTKFNGLQNQQQHQQQQSTVPTSSVETQLPKIKTTAPPHRPEDHSSLQNPVPYQGNYLALINAGINNNNNNIGWTFNLLPNRRHPKSAFLVGGGVASFVLQKIYDGAAVQSKGWGGFGGVTVVPGLPLDDVAIE
ncbi:hypothetical protein CSAL01_07053 [Colletotrichum salicis]|uniref:Uncharacterized protein n=1 Tax=Colletotrichum salicis TaxID=1209931 RepID=A0A135UI73_9PEZI|nr:hypothetical protein CSAL01_07053 [Colletotrichum salicis]